MTSSTKRSESDKLILALNSVGISLARIAQHLKVHPSTITHRLQTLGVEPVDTRRAFMEDIFYRLTVPQQQWLIKQLGPDYTVKDFIKTLIMKEYLERQAA